MELINHLSDEIQGHVTSYVLVASYINNEGETVVYADTYENQPLHSSIGLLEFGKMYLHNKVINTFNQ